MCFPYRGKLATLDLRLDGQNFIKSFRCDIVKIVVEKV